jgi:integrase
MNFVQPIRDTEDLKDIEVYLERKNMRDCILFLLGIYTGLRISDILRIRVKDVKDRSHLVLRERKTKKEKMIKIHPHLKRALKNYLVDKKPEEFLIKSRVGKNKPITRERAYGILQEVAEEFNIDSLGCHSLRKTMGYHFYKQTKNIAVLQELFNHSSPHITLRYIGMNQDTMDEAIMKFKYE